MQSTRQAAANRLVGALAGTLLLASLLAAPQATAARGELRAAPPHTAVVARGAGYNQPEGSARVRRLQLRLDSAGVDPGPVDGLFGPLTEAAVRRFQVRERLAVDGIVGGATRAALQRRLSRLRSPGSGSGRPEKVKPKAIARPGKPLVVPAGASGPSGLGSPENAWLGLGAGLALASGLLALTLAKRAYRRGAPVLLAAAFDTGGVSAPAGAALTTHARGHVPLDGSPGPTGTRVFGYACAERQPGNHSDGELQAQAKEIASECQRRGFALVEVVREREPRRGSPLERPGLGYALEQILAGQAQGLVVAELSRLSSSVPDLGRVLEWFSRSNTRLVAVAQGLDTDHGDSRLVFRTLIEVSGWERERLIERTREGMRAARRKGPPGVSDDPQLGERIALMRAQGMTLQGISDRLNSERVPTVRGGVEWRPSSVQAAAGYRRPAPGARQRVDSDGSEDGWGVERSDADR